MATTAVRAAQRALLAARPRSLAAGRLALLGDAIAEECALALGARGCVVDLGALTGWPLPLALDRLPDRVGVALDLSLPALRGLCGLTRGRPRSSDAVGVRYRSHIGVTAAALSLFATRYGAEIARVLAPDCALVVVLPRPDHLRDPVEPLGLLGVDPLKPEHLRHLLGPGLEAPGRVSLSEASAVPRSTTCSPACAAPTAAPRSRARARRSAARTATRSTSRGRDT